MLSPALKKTCAYSALLIFSLATLSGCSYTIKRYDIVDDNVTELRKIIKSKSVKIAVGEFTSFRPNYNLIRCRAVGEISIEGQQTYHAYIRAALIEEFKKAGIYAEDARLVITSHLEDIDFDSSVGDGKWIIKMTVSRVGTDDIKLNNAYYISTNMLIGTACTQVAQAFVPAVQGLLKELYNHPKFKKLLGIQSKN